VGDACAFIDPVFSTGVYLAMTTGFWAADVIDQALRMPKRADKLLRRYDAATRSALGSFTWFIYRIREPAMRNLFMSPSNRFRVEEAVLSLLAGGIFYDRAIRLRLYLFRLIYYVAKFSHMRSRFGQRPRMPSRAADG
jgi:flavin-dependent dehydrogenase